MVDLPSSGSDDVTPMTLLRHGVTVRIYCKLKSTDSFGISRKWSINRFPHYAATTKNACPTANNAEPEPCSSLNTRNNRYALNVQRGFHLIRCTENIDPSFGGMR